MSEVKRWRISYQDGVFRDEGGACFRSDVSAAMVLASDYDARSLELQAVREALRRYGDHSPKCSNDPRAKCTCGFEAALKQSRGAM